MFVFIGFSGGDAGTYTEVGEDGTVYTYSVEVEEVRGCSLMTSCNYGEGVHTFVMLCMKT